MIKGVNGAMKFRHLLLTAAPLALGAPAWANDTVSAPDTFPKSATVKDSDMVSTGMARGRDRLDSATSTSTLKESEIQKIGARSLGELFRNIPGIRSSYGNDGDNSSSISVRGLPLANGGAKFLQLQEDGLPVLEFGDIAFGTADGLIRADLNIAQIEAIRGGSASTFSSNSPGGIVNLISKTGDVEGGAIQATTGLDYESYRLDFDYGAKISDTLRFHFGGFYRQGEGPRAAGYDAFKGGQFKFNITKQFDGGHVRIYGKYLDDSTPSNFQNPALLYGTNANPVYGNIQNFQYNGDTLLTRYTPQNLTLDENNNITRSNRLEGARGIVKSIGLEAQFSIADWSISERFRFSDVSASVNSNLVAAVSPAQALADSLAGPGAILSYATGPNAGRTITNPASINGNGLIALLVPIDTRLKSLDNMTNDLRASRVWDIGKGKLTMTFGFYKSSQDLNSVWQWTSVLSDIAGNGNTGLVNVSTSGGTAITQNGYLAYGTSAIGGIRRDVYDMRYNVNAPYASVNYHSGKIAVGGSLRYDFGDAGGTQAGSETGGCPMGNPTCITTRDINGDGIISIPERQVAFFPITNAGPVNYQWHYLSYSVGVNYHAVEPFSLFARYSRGGRAAADRILFGNIVNPVTGNLFKQSSSYDPVKQAEMGLKFRKDGLTLNLTGFWAKTHETNIGIERDYRAVGAEFEGAYRLERFAISAGATYTDAKIMADALDPTLVNNRPKNQPKFIYQIMPEFDIGNVALGANIIGQSSSYAADTNQLQIPGYTIVGAFAQYRPSDRVTLSLNVNNLFDKAAVISTGSDATIPASGIVQVNAVNGRTISTSLRFDF